ncbi:Cytochrome c551 peroxidase (plasmid) [Asticcacaulis sp. MM231]|uniref:MbnH family di-heme enzyme n=1 Tax=Asticcacaulis sp. MM231 TaxID=3157666 RepID=UPI0032D5A48F
MKRFTLALYLAAFAILGIKATGASAKLSELGDFVVSKFDFHLPAWAPQPLEPKGNPTTKAKVELGRYLFYDTRLSVDGTLSCASCHIQSKAFTDGRPTSIGVTGQHTPRNAMPLVNAAYFPALTWSNPLLHTAEQQALVPLTNVTPPELGIDKHEDEMITRLKAEPMYPKLFRAAFPEAKGDISLATLTRALAAFERSIVSFRSPYDRYRYDNDMTVMSDAALRGEALFFGERLECHHCHNGLNFTDSERHARNPMGTSAFHNTGLYNMDGKGGYPADNTGIREITGRDDDMGRMRTPSLRNVAVTAPYFHDGSAKTLDDVIDHYAAGGRTIQNGPNAGVGKNNPLKSSFISGFTLTPSERDDLKAFLNSLTDDAVLTDPRFSDPWPKPQRKIP